MADRIQIRRDPAALWTQNNPVLSDGEMGLENDTRKVKVGNGSSAWNSLPYINAPIESMKAVWQFKFTDSNVARPSVPSYVSVNWVGPAGSGGTPPVNMANDDSWDMTA